MAVLHLALEHLPPTVNRLFIAFSAGIDSSVLLHRLINQPNDYQLILWHINHGLQHNAAQMQQLALDLAQQYQLEIRIDHLDLNPSAGNLEAQARHARYALFRAQLTSQDALCTAHHMNDQAETLMLNLMRGSGAGGLRGIADLTALGDGFLFRPLLHFQRTEIEQYAQQHKLPWVEDPSNQSMLHDRNYLRHQVLPGIKKRWPAVIQQLHRVSEWQKEQYQLLQQLAQIDYQECVQENYFSSYSCLSISSLDSLSPERQKNLIRFWISSSNHPQLGFRKLQQLLTQLGAAANAMPQIQAEGFSLRCYNGLLFKVDDIVDPDLEPVYPITGDQQLEISALNISLNRQTLLSYLNLPERGQGLALHFRSDNTQGADSNSHRRKRLYQKHRVPPWLRNNIAQIHVDEELVSLLL